MTPTPTQLQAGDAIRVDIVSDVVCPWCIVGWRQLEQALAAADLAARPRWHPFELNPDMPPEGQNLGEHIAGKYGSSPDQSRQMRSRLTELGAGLGFTFRFSEDSRIVNTLGAHQLLDWASDKGRQHQLKMALFSAYFTDAADVSQTGVLVAAAAAAGLDGSEARQVLDSGERAASVREKQRFWRDAGITGVPAMVFAGRYLATGAQGTDVYGRILQRCLAERDSGAPFPGGGAAI